MPDPCPASPRRSCPRPTRPDRRRPAVVVAGALCAVALVAGACGSTAGSPAAREAAAAAGRANLVTLDLPAGWSPVRSSAGGVTASTLAASQASAAGKVLATLPRSCTPYRGLLRASLVGGAPAGTLGQSESVFDSSADGTVLTSTVAVSGSAAAAGSTFALYRSSALPSCLEGFLTALLRRLFGYSGVSVTVSAVPPPAVAPRTRAVAWTVEQSGTEPGSQQNVSSTREIVVHEGRALAFVEAQSSTTALAPDAVTVLDGAAATVSRRLHRAW